MNRNIHIHRFRVLLLPVFLLLFSLRLMAQPPTISTFSPQSGSTGSSITITGTGFNTTMSNNIVFIGGMKATVTNAAATSLTVTVPNGSVYGTISVLNTGTGLLAFSTQYFLPVQTPSKLSLIKADLTPSGFTNMPNRMYGMISGDLNGDNKPDIVTNDNGFTATISNTLAIKFNNSTTAGAISFGSSTTSVTFAGYNGQGVPSLGDLNGDGLLDVTAVAALINASGTAISSDVFILRNLGNGSFAQSGPFPVAVGGTSSETIDVDGDGKADVVVTCYHSSTVSILRNISSGSTIDFEPKSDISIGSSSLESKLVDINADGKPDLVSIRSSSNNFRVRLNTSTPGNISFGAAFDFVTGNGPSAISAGDIDGDGKLDLVIMHVNQTYFSILRNTSDLTTPSFVKSDIDVGSSQLGLALGDINGDGKPDITLSVSQDFGGGNHRIYVLRNNSTVNNASFDIINRILFDGMNSFPRQLVIADFNADGKQDIISGNPNTNRIYAYRNTTQSAPVITSFSPVSGAPGNSINITGTGFNASGTNAVYFGATKVNVTGTGSTTSLTVTIPVGASYGPLTLLHSGNGLLATSTQQFAPVFQPAKNALQVTDFISQGTITSTGSSIYGLITADLNNDGKPEIIETDRTGNQLFIRQNNSTSGNISFSTTLTKDFSAYGQPGYPAAGDLDGDGLIDIVVPSFATNNMVVMRNTGVLNTTTISSNHATGINPIAAAIGDIDGDGKLDIVVANSGSSTISIFRNLHTYTGSISFDTRLDFPIGTHEIFAVHIADIDGDGKPDIITQNTTTGAVPASFVSVFRNTSAIGDISMAVRQDFTTLSAPWGMAVGDLDGDGKADLVISNSASNTSFSVFRSTSTSGSVNFHSRQDIGTVKGQKWVSIGDLNGDGKPDVVLSLLDPITASDYKIALFPNTSSSGTITFGAQINLDASPVPQVNIIQDMDGDHKPDILSASFDDKNIHIYSNKLIATPLTQAINITALMTGTTAGISWTSGTGSKRLVFVSEGNSGSASPVNNTDYTSNTTFGSGTQIGSTGWYCVYKGTGSSVTVNGLTPSTSYRVMVTEFNDGNLSGVAQYLVTTTTGNPVTITALATITGISRTTASATVSTGSVDYAVSFASAVTGLSASNFSIGTTGSIAGVSVTNVTGNAGTYTVTVHTGTGDGNITLSLSNIAGVTPALTNTLPFTGQAYTIDKTIPTLTMVAITSNNSNTSQAKTGDVVTIDFSSNESITTPTVTIAGQTASVTNTAGNDWSASYTMTDNETDGNITFNIVFHDLPGNAGVAVTSTTNSSTVLFDKVAPVLSSVSIISSNTNTNRATTGDVVTLSFTANEAIVTPIVTLAGHTLAVSNTAANNWSASYTIVNSDTEGDIPFNIDFKDIAGNTGTSVSVTTNSSNVIIDKTVPVLSSVSIASNNTSTDKAKVGDIVTLSFTANEDITTPSVTIAGQTTTVSNTSGNNWIASYTLTNSDTEGNISFSISFGDLSGNNGIAVTATSNSTGVVFDKTLPTLTPVTITSSNANASRAKVGDVITLLFTSSETIPTPTVTIASGNAIVSNISGNNWSASYTMTVSDTEGNIPFNIAFNDLSGNSGINITTTTNSSNVVFAKNAPVLTFVGITSNNSNNSVAIPGNTVTLSFTSATTIQVPAVTIAGQTVTAINSGGNNWVATYTMNGSNTPGIVSFHISFSDLSSNAGSAVTTTTNSSAVTFSIPTGNNAPLFAGGHAQTLSVCSNTPAVAISQLLRVTDTDNGQNLTWSIITAPAHGTISGLPVTIVSNTSTITPGGITFQPTANYSGADAFVVRVSDGIATADVTVSITIKALPAGSITATQGTILCGNNASLLLTVSGGATYQWFKDGINIPGTTPQITITETGTYTATILSSEGCEVAATGSINVTRLLSPTVQFAFDSYCANTPVQFTNQSVVTSSGPVSYQWTDTYGNTSASSSPAFLYPQAGSFDVKLKVIPQACPTIADSIIKTINIVSSVPGIRLPTINIAKSTMTVLQARTQPGATYTWTPNRFLINTNTSNPQVFANEEQEYQISVATPGGCMTVDTLLMRIQENHSVFVANVFTPNGDGQNDKLMVNTVANIKSLRFFRVYNRWGKLLFETRQLGDGWDGRHNGQLQPMDTYTWIIEAIDESGAIIKKQGSATLLR